MTIVVGLSPDHTDTAALDLAAMLARSAGDDLVGCIVIPLFQAPPPEPAATQYQALVEKQADAALARAQGRQPQGVATKLVVRHARSAPAGLVDVVDEVGARMLVLGPTATGVFGQVSMGSVTERLVHSAPVAVAVAPHGFRCRQDARVARVTAAYGGLQGGSHTIAASTELATTYHASLRAASFAVRPTAAFLGHIEQAAEDLVANEWIIQTVDSIANELADVRKNHAVPSAIETVIGQGFSWPEALSDVPWSQGDILVVGSSSAGTAARAFLGSRASKIMKHAPVPVMLLPASVGV
jgi:nucleotide-binding universal stress UspA family protein